MLGLAGWWDRRSSVLICALVVTIPESKITEPCCKRSCRSSGFVHTVVSMSLLLIVNPDCTRYTRKIISVICLQADRNHPQRLELDRQFSLPVLLRTSSRPQNVIFFLVVNVSTHDQLVDIFTKALPKETFQHLRHHLGMCLVEH